MDVDEFLSNCDENFTFHSELCEKLKSEDSILGIDEAGRGPVLGPMVYGACFCPLSCEEELSNLGCDDSKVLKEEQRDELFNTIDENTSKFMGWIITILSPNFLSNSMLSRTKYNLNSISHDTAINLIKSVLKMGVKVKKVYVDTVGPPQTYQEKLQKIFPDIEITVEKKADSKFPIVSAASICAKVCRDKVLSDWKFKENPDMDRKFGSGYTSDPATKTWLQSNVDRIFGFPTFVRFSWSTAQKVLDDKAVAVEWPDEENDGDSKSNTPAITNFFGAKKSATTRHEYFTSSKLSHIESF